jgi:hypothetical protein
MQLEVLNYPQVIKSDFENASIGALKECFPNSRISGCAFHLGQSISRKVQKSGLHLYIILILK